MFNLLSFQISMMAVDQMVVFFWVFVWSVV